MRLPQIPQAITAPGDSAHEEGRNCYYGSHGVDILHVTVGWLCCVVTRDTTVVNVAEYVSEVDTAWVEGGRVGPPSSEEGRRLCRSLVLLELEMNVEFGQVDEVPACRNMIRVGLRRSTMTI